MRTPQQKSLPPSKLTFDELLRSFTIFFYDPDVEDKFNEFIEEQAKQIREANIGHGKPNANDVLDFILNQGDALDRILGILRIPREKFLRIVSLIRELEGPIDQVLRERVHGREWNLEKIERKFRENMGIIPSQEG